MNTENINIPLYFPDKMNIVALSFKSVLSKLELFKDVELITYRDWVSKSLDTIIKSAKPKGIINASPQTSFEVSVPEKLVELIDQFEKIIELMIEGRLDIDQIKRAFDMIACHLVEAPIDPS